MNSLNTFQSTALLNLPDDVTAHIISHYLDPQTTQTVMPFLAGSLQKETINAIAVREFSLMTNFVKFVHEKLPQNNENLEKAKKLDNESEVKEKKGTSLCPDQRGQLLSIIKENTILGSANLTEVKLALRQLRKETAKVLKELKEEDFKRLEESCKTQKMPLSFEDLFKQAALYKEIDKVEKLSNQDYKDSDYRLIAAKLGLIDSEEAINIAEKITSVFLQTMAFEYISEALIEENKELMLLDIDKAIDIALRIISPAAKMQAVERVFSAIIKKNKASLIYIDRAIEAVEKISDLYVRNYALIDISENLIQIDPNKAIDLIELIDPEVKDLALIRISKALISVNITLAKRIAKKITDLQRRGEVFGRISRILVEKGIENIVEALNIVDEIPKEEQEAALCGISQALAPKNTDMARRIAEMIKFDRKAQGVAFRDISKVLIDKIALNSSSSLKEVREALDIAEKIESPYEREDTFLHIVKKLVLINIVEAISVAAKIKDPDTLDLAFLEISKRLLSADVTQTADVTQKKIDLAINIAKRIAHQGIIDLAFFEICKHINAIDITKFICFSKKVSTVKKANWVTEFMGKLSSDRQMAQQHIDNAICLVDQFLPLTDHDNYNAAKINRLRTNYLWFIIKRLTPIDSKKAESVADKLPPSEKNKALRYILVYPENEDKDEGLNIRLFDYLRE